MSLYEKYSEMIESAAPGLEKATITLRYIEESLEHINRSLLIGDIGDAVSASASIRFRGAKLFENMVIYNTEHNNLEINRNIYAYSLTDGDIIMPDDELFSTDCDEWYKAKDGCPEAIGMEWKRGICVPVRRFKNSL